jgi:hypothetical protein
MTQLRVKALTYSHIDLGTPCKFETCPIALALKEVFPGAMEVYVKPGYTRVVFQEYNAMWLDHSRGVTEWINQFDHNQVVLPGTLVLRFDDILKDGTLELIHAA